MLAETEAQAFKDAGYKGIVPNTVQAWATAKQQTSQWAADDILATAAQWRNAQTQIRAERLLYKQKATDCKSIDTIISIGEDWRIFVAAVKQQLGI
jgi:hypothetical protein